MSTAFKISDDGLYFLTFQIVGWVDIFTRKVYRDIVIDSLIYCQQHKGLSLFAYVIMSNHIHLLAQSDTGNLSGIRTHENHAEHIYSQEFIEQKADYIHNNPVRAGIVSHPEDYLYSSARNYAELNSVMEVVKLDFKWKVI